MPKAASDGWADALTGRRVVVTGGAGFLGGHVCEALVDAEAEVVCLDNLSSGSIERVRHLDGDRLFSFVQGDVVESCDVDGPVDLILHLACVASPPAYQRQPLATLRSGSEGTLNALRLGRDKAARVVLASTSEVYGDPDVSPQPETYRGNVDPIGARSMYDEAKRFSEALTVASADEWALSVGIVRIFNTYGPGMHPYDGRIVSTFVRQALAGEPITIHGDGTQTRSLCHVSDTVAGMLTMAASAHRGPVNLGNPDERSVRELAELIRTAVGSSSPLAFVDAAADDPRRRCPDVRLAAELLGWRPRVSLADGIADTVAWYRNRS